MQQQTTQEQIREAHALAQSIPYVLTAKRKHELNVLETLKKAFK